MRDWQKLRAENPDVQFQRRFQDLYCLRTFLYQSVWMESFVAEDEWNEVLEFTPAGVAFLESESHKGLHLSETQLKLLVFLKFYQKDLLIDVTTSATPRIKDLIEGKLWSDQIKLPWFFDHLLYDRAFDLGIDRQDEKLSREETTALLEGTLIGVFQMAEQVVGPFGILSSSQPRRFSPMREVALGHCADPNCSALHVSRLSQIELQMSELVSRVAKDIEALQGERRDWSELFFKLTLPPGYYYDDYSLGGLVWFLGNGFSEGETRLLLTSLLQQKGKGLRSKLPSSGKWRSLFAAPGHEIAGKLSKPELLQLVLLASDDEIVASIDDLVERREIKVPPSEIRTAVTFLTARNWIGAKVSCSSLGIRVTGNMPPLSLARLRRLVLNLYAGEADRNQLYWLLRNYSGDTLGEKVEALIDAEAPEDVLRTVAFSNQDKLREALSEIRASHLASPNNLETENRLIVRMLWKIGFSQTKFPSPLGMFYERLDTLRKIAQTQGSSPEEKWREQVRSVGANFFVSLEEILELSLPFVTWTLLSDHLAETHRYNSERARAFTRLQISGLLSTDRGPIEYLADKKNTLFPLISGFAALRERVQMLLDQGGEHFLKPKVLMGHYTHESRLQLFPYRHRHFIFDMVSADLERSLALVERISRGLNASNAMKIRNSIDHQTEEFPNGSDVEQCCQKVSEIIEESEKAGFVPLLYANVNTATDTYGRKVISSRDYRGRSVTWRRSPALTVLRTLPAPESPQILVPSIRLGDSAEILRFLIEETSDYYNMWHDYPKRRVPSDAELAEAESVSAAIH